MKTSDIQEDCIPAMFVLSSQEELNKIAKAIFFLLLRIDLMDMQDSLIHVDKDLSKWWQSIYKGYEEQVVKKKLILKVTNLLSTNFTAEELKYIAAATDFNVDIKL